MPAESNSCGLEEWRSFARPFFDVIPTGGPETFRAHAMSDKLGWLVVSDVGFDAAIFDRDPGKLRGFDSEFPLLETYDSGTNKGRAGDLGTGLDAGSVHVFDMAQSWRTQTTAVACRSVVIPYEVIGFDPGRQAAYSGLAADSPRNAMLLAAMSALFDAAACHEAESAEALAESCCGLVQRLMFNQNERETENGAAGGPARFLRQFIEEHLGESNLGPQRRCDAIGFSRATLYRMFSEQGGVRGHITARRLDRCFDELRQGPAKRGRVRKVAARWGFYDAKGFNRAFRARFGIAPSDCLDRPVTVESGFAAGHSINDWMRQL